MTTLVKAIKAINPIAECTFNDDDLDSIQWVNGTTPISKADILAKQAELQAEYDAQDYARKRQAEYPTIHDLVVALYDSEDKAAIDAKRAEIKLKYQKG